MTFLVLGDNFRGCLSSLNRRMSDLLVNLAPKMRDKSIPHFCREFPNIANASERPGVISVGQCSDWQP